MEIDYHHELKLNDEKKCAKNRKLPENCSEVTSPSRKRIRENSDSVEMK